MKQQAAVWNPDLGNGYYRNPIIHADYSDPDIVRVGDDFYLVSSSFNHMPALPILHSRDLVNWRIVNHVFASLDLPGYDQVQPGKGVWAPSIRYHNGMFWVFFSTPDEGIFMSTATDPLGQWSPLHCVKAARGWIDPCPFWDSDGSAWLVHGFAFSRSGLKHQLQLCPMSDDGRRLLDDGRIIYDGTVDQPTLEGPKFYKRNGWYYIFAPAGGVPTGWQTVLRARSLQGPYESKVVLHQGSTSINGPHQGGFVELDNGESWFVHFQDAFAYGRIVHLQPVAWQEDWPVMGENQDSQGIGEPVLRHPKPTVEGACPSQVPQTADDFRGSAPGLQWQWQANPKPAWWSMSRDGLTLTVQALPRREQGQYLYDAPNLLMQKFPAQEFVATTAMRFDLQHAGERAGLIVYGERYACLAVHRTAQGVALRYQAGWMNDRNLLTEIDMENVDLVAVGQIFLRVTVRQDALCTFAWSIDGQSFTDCACLFAAGPGKWVGAKLGLFAVSAQETKSAGSASFDFFKVEPI